MAYLDEAAAGVLNVTLYRRCVEVFDRVRVTNAGESRICCDVGHPGSPSQRVVQQGEYYVVCCPLCSDTRYRCYINHMYGTEGTKGFPQTHLVHCFNDGCPLSLSKPEAFQRMRDILLGYKLYDFRRATIRPGKAVNPLAKCRMFPGSCTPVGELPADHTACEYLQSRGFDPKELQKWFDVRWCTTSENWLARDRIIIPIYHVGRLVGWQARPPFDLDSWKTVRYPKYYTASGTPKRSVLYSLDLAKQFRSVVVTEGATDVWRFGGPAVAVLGAGLTQSQIDLLSTNFSAGAAVLMFDADILDNPKTAEHRHARTEAIAAAGVLQNRLAGGCCIVSPPAGWDPGSMPKQELRNYVQQRAAASGVTIDWEVRGGS